MYFPGKTKRINQSIETFIWISIFVIIVLSLFDLGRGLFDSMGDLPPLWTGMKVITSLFLLITSVVLILIVSGIRSRTLKVMTRPLSLFMVITSLLIFYVQYFVFKTGNEPSFTSLPVLRFFIGAQNRMTLFASFNFILIGIIIYLLTSSSRRSYNFAHILVLPVILISYFFIVGYVLGIYSIGEVHIAPVSLSTGISFIALCTAILLIRPGTWLMEVFVSDRIGGILARRFTFPFLVIPVIVGWLRITGERTGIFRSDEGVIMISLTFAGFSILLIWLTSKTANRIDQLRQGSEEALRRSNARLALLSEISSQLLKSHDPQKLVNELCSKVMAFLDCQFFFNYLVDNKAEKLHLNSCGGISKKDAETLQWLDYGVAVSGCVARDRQAIVVENVQHATDEMTYYARSFGVTAYACHPLLSHNKVIGTLSFGTKKRNHFNKDEISIMKTVTDQVAIAMDRIHNERALRESEDRFKTIAEALPVLISITRVSDKCFEFTNEAFDLALGYKRGDLIGKKSDFLFFNPEDQLRLSKSLEKKGELTNIETMLKRSDGSFIWVMASIRIINFDNIPCYLSAIIDITDRKNEQEKLVQLNRALNALSKSSQAMMHAENEMQYINDICKIIIDECNYHMVWVGYAQNDPEKSVKPIAYYGFDDGYINAMNITWADTERGRGPTGTTIRTGIPTVCNNMITDPAFAPWKEEAAKRGYASSIVLPLKAEERIFGSISIYSRNTNSFGDQEIDLLSGLANDLAYGITNIRLTDTKIKAAQELKSTKDYVESLINYANALIIVWNRETEIQLFNRAFERLTGYSANEVMGKKLDFLFPEATKKNTNEKIRHALTSNWEALEIPILTSNNDLRIVLWNSANIYDDKGEITSIMAQGNDITGRIIAEEAVRSAKEKLDLTLENANIGIWSWDIRNDRFSFDERIEKMTGLKQNDAFVKFEDFEKFIFEEDLPHLRKEMHNALTDNNNLDTIFRIQILEGEFKYIHIKARTEKDTKDKPTRMTGVCLDITEMNKRTELTLLKLNDNLLRSNKELEQFAYVASHDLQEPLRMVSSFTQLLARKYENKLDKEALEFINFAVDGAQRMQKLINDLLDYSRIKTRGKNLTLLDANILVQQALHNLTIKINEKNARIRCKKLPYITADEGQIVQLFQNLIDNSLKFTNKIAEIDISAKEEKDQVLFIIKDNGIGIEPQYYDRIFQIFQRLHQKNEFGGTGIGLAICKRIVERHGGNIWVENGGEGTIFKFTLKKNNNIG